MIARSSRVVVLLLLCLIALLSYDVRPAAAGDAKAARALETERLQRIVDELKGRLGIEVTVAATLVTQNPLLVSVRPSDHRKRAFEMSFQDGFSATLDDDTVRAVVAHELGHVWIFLHHPYLQTERLANDVALRLVSRDSLTRLYDRLTAAGVMKGDLARYLGR